MQKINLLIKKAQTKRASRLPIFGMIVLMLAVMISACAAPVAATPAATAAPTQAQQGQQPVIATQTTASTTSGHIKSVTEITEVFGDGQKVSAAAVEYDKDIDNSKLSKSAFSVSGRTITNVYGNTAPAKTSQGVNGKYVIIELSLTDANISTLGNNGGSGGPGQTGGTPSNPPAQGAGSQGMSPSISVIKVSVTRLEM
jgi:hypothetical protein